MSEIDWSFRASKLEHKIENFINGHRRSPGGSVTIDKFAPRDGSLLYRLPAGDARDVQDAIAVARQAFDDGRWSRISSAKRRTVLVALADLIETRGEELALLECLDVGKPISDALSVDIPSSAQAIRAAAETADRLLGTLFAADTSSLSYQLRRPLGVVGAIVGWNFPLALAANKIGPALATGNSLVLKPSELSSLATVRLAELAFEAGVPEGVFNVIHGDGAIGDALARHEDVDLITFTGSTRTGQQLLIASGQSNMKRLVLECGGKAPNIIFDDCPDLNSVAEAVLQRAFWNQGQVCSAGSRLLIHNDVSQALLRLLVDKAQGLRTGDPLLANTSLGAVVSGAHKEKIDAYVASGEAEGAKLLFQADSLPPFENGFYATPTIFDRVSPTQRIAREEIFGPVLSVMRFADEAEAIRLANDTPYGLSATVWTVDAGRAHRMAYGLKSGWTVINATASPAGGPTSGVMSLGGHKRSGIGVEGGVGGLGEYLSQTGVQIFV